MTRAIKGLLELAAQEALNNDGVVPTDTAMRLAAEGYDITKLDREIERILERAQ